MTKKKPAVPAAKPRQPLTKKRRGAISAYVMERGDKYGYIAHFMIDLTLKAERMDADKLYNWLESKGYRWRNGIWTLRTR